MGNRSVEERKEIGRYSNELKSHVASSISQLEQELSQKELEAN